MNTSPAAPRNRNREIIDGARRSRSRPSRRARAAGRLAEASNNLEPPGDVRGDPRAAESRASAGPSRAIPAALMAGRPASDAGAHQLVVAPASINALQARDRVRADLLRRCRNRAPIAWSASTTASGRSWSARSISPSFAAIEREVGNQHEPCSSEPVGGEPIRRTRIFSLVVLPTYTGAWCRSGTLNRFSNTCN